MNKVSAYLLAFVLWMLLHLNYIVHNFFYMCKYDFFPALYELSVSDAGSAHDGTGKECLSGDVQRLEAYVLDAELADGVVHQDGEVLHHHPDVPVGPAALIRPVLVALVLQGAARGG